MSSSNKKKILLVGCSNLIGHHHAFADVVFGENKLDCLNRYLDENYYNPTDDYAERPRHLELDDIIIDNLSMAGAGNEYITSTLLKHMENYDYVFIQFSGLMRHDLYTNNQWMLSGGINGILGKSNYYFRQYYKNNRYSHLKKIMLTCKEVLKLLDKTNIKYNWCFYYDTKVNHSLEDHESVELDHRNKVSPDPHTYCEQHGYLADDGCHFMYDGYREWLVHVKDQLNT